MDDAIRAFMTFLELERHASHETVRNYASDLRLFRSFMKTEHPGVPMLDPATVQTESIRTYLHWLDRKREKSTSMARKLSSLRSFYRYLQREGMVGLNPAEAIKMPKQPKHLPRVLTKDDAAALMEFPVDQELHVILDNYSTHKKCDTWLAQHPNVHFHFTPTSASWLNQIEIWFGIMSRKALRGLSTINTTELRQAIEAFIKAYAKNAKPFKWRKRDVKGAQLRNTIVNLCN